MFSLVTLHIWLGLFHHNVCPFTETFISMRLSKTQFCLRTLRNSVLWYDNIMIMFILRAEDSFAARILSLSARAKWGAIMIRVANEYFAWKNEHYYYYYSFPGLRTVTVCRILRIFEWQVARGSITFDLSERTDKSITFSHWELSITAKVSEHE